MMAVVLAAGRGTRMQRATGAAPTLEPAQEAAADRGLKSLIPFHGRAFIEYLLDDIAAAGIGSACIVTGPHTEAVREHLSAVAPPVRLSFVTQPEPRGSADALRAAEPATGGAPFILLNSDNLYPPRDCARLAALGEPGLIGFSREGLVRGGVPVDRIRAFSLIEVDEHGDLRKVNEKPDAATAARLAAARVSMTCWRFDDRIFEAAGSVRPSPRGELELQDAVHLLLARGVTFRVLPSDQPVLDLSTRADVPRVAAALRSRHR